MEDEYPFQSQSKNILDNLKDRSKDVEDVSRSIRRARDVLKRYSASAPPPKGTVLKRVMQGERGALYYLSKSGKRVYLSPGQCKRCIRGKFPLTNEDDTNLDLGCPPADPSKTKCRKTRSEMRREILELKKIIEEDC